MIDVVVRGGTLVTPSRPQDADLALVDLNWGVTLAAGDLHQRHPLT